ncbi:hypothetical protein B0H67DRAFT_467120, partial [Lasiosphaeris hirsuta]
SHCWGTLAGRTDVFMLTRSTLAQLRAPRPVASLPPTFRDAFEIVSRLGLRHLWIDRLCVVQDSPAHWAAEAALMHDIYKHTYLNVSGARRVQRPRRLLLRARSRRHSSCYLRSEWHTQPLVSRAWIVQERLLPPMVLHFGSSQVFWECMALQACDAQPSYPRDEDMSRGQVEGADEVTRLLAEWGEHVVVYSDCKLTMPGDKLVAISGLAKDTQQRLAETGASSTIYLAGLWKCGLANSLLWHRREGHLHPAPPAVYRAPSWSWAAVDG